MQTVNITKELERLWKAYQDKEKVHASLFTLILYVQKTDRTPFYENLIKSVLSKFPCRVIFIIHDKNKEAQYLNTHVNLETIGEGASKIYCELIRIEVAGTFMERIPFIILPHILPDLPLYLLWAQDPVTENIILPYLEPFANRIIFDSESAPNLQEYSNSILSLIKRFHCAIGDLQWSAISGWRQIFASFFDNQEIFQSLVQSNLIHIYFNRKGEDSHRHPEIESFYLQAWLASRLNWKIQGFENHEGNFRITYHRPMDEVVVLLIPQEEPSLPNGAILSVEIESARNKGHFVFKRYPKSRQVCTQFSDKEQCSLPIYLYLPGTQEGQEIIEEIFYPSGTKHYRDMLELLSTISWRNQ